MHVYAPRQNESVQAWYLWKIPLRGQSDTHFRCLCVSQQVKGQASRNYLIQTNLKANSQSVCPLSVLISVKQRGFSLTKFGKYTPLTAVKFSNPAYPLRVFCACSTAPVPCPHKALYSWMGNGIREREGPWETGGVIPWGPAQPFLLNTASDSSAAALWPRKGREINAWTLLHMWNPGQNFCYFIYTSFSCSLRLFFYQEWVYIFLWVHVFIYVYMYAEELCVKL